MLDGLRSILKAIDAEGTEGDEEDAELIERLEELQTPAHAQAGYDHARVQAHAAAVVAAALAAAPMTPQHAGKDSRPGEPVRQPEPSTARPAGEKPRVDGESEPGMPRTQVASTPAESTLRVDVALLNRMMNLVV